MIRRHVHIGHTQADTETDLAAGMAHAGPAGSAAGSRARKGRHARPSPPRGRLCRALRHRLRPAAFDRERGRDPRPAVRGVRSVPSRHGAAGARRQARAARPVAAQDQVDQGDRACDRQGRHRLSTRSPPWRPTRRTRAGRAARHRAVDRRHLSAVLPRPCRRLAGRRPRLAGGGAHRASACGSGRMPKAMAKLAEPWRPWRGVAAHLLWAYYHAVKRRDGAPVQCQSRHQKKRKRKWPR